MGKEELQRLFCAKLSLEYICFREEMVAKDKEEIYENSYYIDTIINIYECLLEMSQELEETVLNHLILFPQLLIFLYHRWMKQEDSYAEELAACMRREITSLGKCGQDVRKEVKDI